MQSDEDRNCPQPIRPEANMKVPAKVVARAAAMPIAALLAACSGGGDSAVTVNGDVPVAYAKRVATVTLNPLNGAPSAPGGDLMVRDKSSPSAAEHNITAQFTQGVGDVTDPEVSYDGKKIVFAMNCPTSNTSTIGGQPACSGRWNIWEYDMTSGGLTGGTFRRITSSSNDDDVAPNYLPAGAGFVFSSNRQTKSFANQALGQSYYALDEYERERVFNLHTMDASGNNVTQISFNQSHDRNPVVRPNGDIMYSRWEHVGGRNRFSVFRAKPDGTDLFVLYGAHSSGNSFLHPRDMDPNGPYKGFISTDLMPLDRTHEGGALMFIDAANYSEENTPANSNVPALGGQKQATAQPLNFDMGLSLFGRITSPYPLWDGTNRVLLAYAPCQVTRSGVVVPCSTLSAAEVTRLSNTNRLTTDVTTDTLQNNVPPSYSVYMFDPANQTFLIVASPPPGFMYKNPVPIQARTEPSAAQPTPVDPTLAAAGLAQIEVRSVYDTDGLGRMGDPVLAAADLATGCAAAIAKTAPLDPLDTRPQVADLVKIKDPANAAYGCAPARFVRVIRAVAPPSGSTGLRQAIGNTDFEPQQILGYAPIEPDGSLKLNIPADTPVALQVLDASGRSFQVHTNWIQARPGERRTCDGCHGPRRGGALNSGAIVNSVPTGWLASMQSAHQLGETMAATLFRMNVTTPVVNLTADPVYTDVWADTGKTGVTARAALAIKYTGNAASTDDLATAVPVNGIINYPDHIQPLWARNRGANTCTTCHADPAKLDLTATIGGTGRMASYEALTVGPPVLDPVTGLPVFEIRDGSLVVKRGAALVTPTGSESDAVGMARKSRLTEIMFGQALMADAAALTTYPNPPASAPNHATMLNAAEKRLLTEWIDLGAKYYNDPFNGASGVRTISTLSQAVFTAQVLPILTKTCAANCHQGIGSNQSPPPGTTFVDNKFVLTGDPSGDFNVTLTMITDACQPASNLLLSMPSTIPHPPTASGQLAAVLPAGSADYNTISSWILSGCGP
jgi:hypothetical protein